MSKDNIEPAIFVYDFPDQLIREKVMMEKPSNFDNYTNGVPDGAFFKSELKVFDEYKKHLASRRTFSYPVSKEQDGKELREGMDFKIQERFPMGIGNPRQGFEAVPIKEDTSKTFLYKTGLRNGFNGWQVWFRVDHQKFYLQPVAVSIEDEENTEEKAKWIEDSLKSALDNLLSKK